MIGSTVGAYRIVSQLGAGGMGVVYKALDTRLQRHVALKVLPQAVSADPERRQRFLQEARAASALNDPHIVTVHDIFEAGGTAFLVMELVEGQTLRELARQPLPIADIVTYVGQIADALSLAHAAGIIHRDLKPGNVMVTERGVVKVLDFGLAKLAARTEDLTTAQMTRTGDVMGTVEYMSPEQARGAAVDWRTDIYSLGAMLDELLAAGARHVPGRLDRVAKQALEREPAKRFQSMKEFAAALRAAHGGRFESRHAWVAGALAVAAVVAIAVAARGSAGDWIRSIWAPETSPAPADSASPGASVELPSTPFEAYQLGQSLLARYDRDGYLDRSIESFRRALDARPEYPAAAAGLAMAYWRKYREQRDRMLLGHAESYAQRAVAADPNLTLGLVAQSLVNAERGEFAAAEKTLGNALAQDPKNADVMAARGHLRVQQRNLAAALEDVRQARTLRAGDWSLALMEGVVLMNAGRPADAVSPLAEAAKSVPDSALVLRNLGGAYYAIERYPDAIATFQRALEIKPDPVIYNNLGTIFYFRGLYDQAVLAFERAVQMRPNDFRTWSSLADSYRLLPGRKSDAERAYTRTLQLLDEQLAATPDSLDLRTRRAGSLARRGDCAEAMKAIASLDLSRATPTEQYRAAVTSEVCGRRDEALALLEKAITAGYSLDQLNNDPELERLRADIRFHQFLASRKP